MDDGPPRNVDEINAHEDNTSFTERKEERKEERKTIDIVDVVNEEEEDVCPICLSPLTEYKDDALTILLCCGKLLCVDCGDKLSKRGDQNCAMCRAHLHKTDKEKFELTMKHAEMGKAWALNNIGNYFKLGEGCMRDDEKAVYYYKLAAAKGKKEAISNLGYCHQVGEGVDCNPEMAFYYFNIAAEKGFAEAQFQVAECYRLGQGVQIT